MDTVPDTEDAPLEPAPYGPLPVGSGRRAWARRPATEAEAKAMASPLRLRIVRITLHEPHTNKEIAEVLGLNPASVLHHVRTLVDTGFLIEQPVRRGPRGSRERPYLASGKTWYLDMGLEERGVATSDLLLRTFLDEVKSVPDGALANPVASFAVSLLSPTPTQHVSPVRACTSARASCARATGSSASDPRASGFSTQRPRWELSSWEQ